MVLERVKQVKRVLGEICYFKRLLKTYGEHLLPGQYYLFPGLRAIAATRSLEKAKTYFGKKAKPSKTQKLISAINGTNYYRNKRQSNLETYEAVYSANNYDKVREIKLFSFERNEILTFCTCEQARQKQLEEYEGLRGYFGMPRVQRQDVGRYAYKISMVTLVPRPEERLSLEAVCRCVAAYYQAHRAEQDDVLASQIMNISYPQKDIQDLLLELTQRIDPAVLEMRIPLCFQHGDLSRDNLLYGSCDGKTDFWWIDWEHARQRIFFYDYFFYILNTAVYYHDMSALKAYLCGDYQPHLQEFFAQFGLRYDQTHCRDYLLIFAVAFLKERVCDLNNTAALKMYCDFLNEMIWNEA